MALELELVAGQRQQSDGLTDGPLRVDRFGSLVDSHAIGKYYELARTGKIFMAAMQAGASLGTALTATAVTVTLYNPSGSGINMSVISGAVTFTSQTAGVSVNSLVWAANVDPAAAIPTGQTALTVRPALVGGAFTSAGRALSAATLPAAPVIVRVFPLGASQVVTTAAALAGLSAVDYVDGAISLAPNTAVTIQGIGTTNQAGIVSVVWAEIPV